MTSSSFRDALKPIAARLPRTVREHEILRVSATVMGDNPKKTADAARHEVLKWAEKRCGGDLPEEAWNCEGFEYLSGGRNSVGVRLKNDVTDIWTIRADDPDKNVAGRTWTTEVVIGLMHQQAPQFSARLLVSTPEDELDINPHTPGFVQQVTEQCGLSRERYEFSSEPWVIDSEQQAEALIELLLNPGRSLPVFVLTVPEDASDPNRPLLDTTRLARATLGIAYVVKIGRAHV